MLVHLGPRGYAIHGQHDTLARAHKRKDAVHVGEDGSHHGRFVFGWGTVFRVAARMDDAVHVEVEAEGKTGTGRVAVMAAMMV